jgi:two-component system sensor histidine kinase GlrK
VGGPTDLQALGRQLEWLRVRLLELAQEKNRFLRHMSHELKTPLANIREGTDLLLDGAVGPLEDPQREVTDILRSNGLKLQRLIENLLSFSAWQTKSEMLMLSDFSLKPLIVGVLKDYRLPIKAQGIRLALDVEDIRVNADAEKLRTALDNLISNAIKYTPRGGHIQVRAIATSASFVIDIADSGPGIPAEERSRIFQAFYQGANQQHDGPVAGTGIGLSVVLECVEAHGGSVELVDSPWGGAHFRLHVPQEQISANDRMAANA